MSKEVSDINDLVEKITEENIQPDSDFGTPVGRETQDLSADRIARLKEILAQVGKGKPPIPGDELPDDIEK